MLIRRTDRLDEVLERDAGMVEILASVCPELQGLRNPVARRVVGPRTTVEEVARIAGLEPDILVRRVNHALGGSAGGRRRHDH